MTPPKIPPKKQRDERRAAYREQDTIDGQRQAAAAEAAPEARRDPPFSMAAERAALAAAAWSAPSRHLIFERLRPEHFYQTRHQYIFSAIKGLDDSFRGIDLATIEEQLLADGKLDMSGGMGYVGQILEADTTGYVHVEEYIGVLVDKWLARRLHHLAQDVLADVHAGGGGRAADVLERVNQEVSEIADAGLQDPVDLDRILDQIFEDHAKVAAGERSEVVRIWTGYSRMDSLLGGGIRVAAVLGIGARTSQGKTTLAMSIMLNILRLHTRGHQDALGNRYSGTEYGVAYFTLEQSLGDMSESCLGNMAEVAVEKIERRTMGADELDRVIAARKQLSAWKKAGRLHIEECPGVNLGALVAKIQRIHRAGKVHVFFIDYVQLIEVPGLETREAIAKAARKLQQLAVALKISIVLLSQLNRGPEDRTDPEPRLSDSKGSGEIEESVWTMLMPYRDPKDEGANVNTMRVRVAKNKKGAQTRGEGNLKLTIRGDWSKVLDRGYNATGEMETGGPTAGGVPEHDYTQGWSAPR